MKSTRRLTRLARFVTQGVSVNKFSKSVDGVAISRLSTVGIDGAFVAIDDAGEIGSPGSAMSVSPVPEPGTFALLLAGLGLVAFVARKRAS